MERTAQAECEEKDTKRAARADDGELGETKRSANAVDACVTMMLGNVSGGLLCNLINYYLLTNLAVVVVDIELV